jgi:hypothetical protein
MKFRSRVYGELTKIDADIRRTPLLIVILISCLALIFAATISFGGLHA